MRQRKWQVYRKKITKKNKKIIKKKKRKYLQNYNQWYWQKNIKQRELMIKSMAQNEKNRRKLKEHIHKTWVAL